MQSVGGGDRVRDCLYNHAGGGRRVSQVPCYACCYADPESRDRVSSVVRQRADCSLVILTVTRQ